MDDVDGRMTMVRTTLFSALALIALVPAAAAAQSARATDNETREERAELYSEQGWLLASQKREFGLAASWLREAALLRGDGPQKVQDLLNAGRFHYYAHQLLVSASALKDAGVLALKLGDRETANRAFQDGAWVALEAGDMVTALDLIGRASPDGRGAAATRGGR